MRFSEMIRNNVYLYQFAVRYAPGLLSVCLIQSLLSALLSILATIWFKKEVFNLMTNSNDFFEFFLLIIVMVIAYLVIGFVDIASKNYFIPIYKQRLHKLMQSDLFKKAINIDIAQYDNSDFYNDFIWSMDDADTRVSASIANLGVLLSQVLYCAFAIGLVFTYDVSVAISIILAIAIASYLNVQRIKISYIRDFELKKLDRKSQYFSRVFYLKEYSKEIRTSNVKDVLVSQFESNNDELRERTLYYGKKTFVINFLMRLTTTSLFDVGIVVIACFKLVTHAINLSECIVLINVVWYLFFKFNGLVNRVLDIYKDGLYSERIKSFMMKESIIENSVSTGQLNKSIESIDINNLSFKYKDDVILNNINLTINAGEKVAIVGHNGSGKSTFIKLLLRLYDPTSGMICINGLNIRNLDLQSYRRRFSAVFQDFKLFSIKVSENVLMDDQHNQQSVSDALIKSGFGEEVDTNLIVFKEFDNNGLNLSGGEQQKLAIARSFAQNSEIIVMDEPSSALDPMVEYEINKQIFNEMKEKTIVFVSHRLSTACLADRIVVFDKGRIVEEGSHKELMELDGVYAMLYTTQASKYQFVDKESHLFS